jgi:hypothetical protein
MRISQTTFSLINSIRDCVRHDEGGGGQCATVVQELLQLPGFEDAYSTAGYFVTNEGNIIDDHWWLVMDDESILDPTQDQFGEGGFGDTVQLSKDDPRYKHYYTYSEEPGIPVEVLQFADKIRASKRTDKNKTFSAMAEASGAAPSSDANRQSPGALPDYVTDGGQEGIPQDPHDEEFKPEEFEDELRQHMTDDIGDKSGECLYCLAVALAIQSQYGGEVWGTWTRYQSDGYEFLAHAYVKHGDLAIDHSGTHPFDYYKDCYDTIADEPYDCVVRPITDEDIKHLGETDSVDDPDAYQWVKKYKTQYDAIFEVDHPEFMPGGDETHGHDPAYDPPAEYRSKNTNTGWPQP